MRRAARHEHHLAGTKFEHFVAELTFIMAFADDVGFVIGRMAVQPCARTGRLDRLAQRVGAAAFGAGRFERQRDAAECVGSPLAG
jgi:hypothetical protein